MEEEKERSSIEDLSDDLTVGILRLLTRVSIFRCLDVCKRWRSLINCNISLLFADTTGVYIAANDGGQRCKSLEIWQREMEFSDLIDFLSVKEDKSHNKNHRDYYSCKERRRRQHRILASCNGLLLSTVSTGERRRNVTWYISNPLTKECVSLPNPPKPCFVYGLAFRNDEHHPTGIINVYKVVTARRFLHLKADEYEQYIYKFQVYSSNTKRWQLIRQASRPSRCCYKLDRNAVYCKGVLYWLCLSGDHTLFFDVETDTSGYLDLPTDKGETKDNASAVLFRGMHGHRLTERDGEMHYIRMCGPELHASKTSTDTRGRLTWLRLHNVNVCDALLISFGLFRKYLQPFPTFKFIDMVNWGGDDRVVLELMESKYILSFNPRSGEFEQILRRDCRPKGEFFFRYTPTTKFIS